MAYVDTPISTDDQDVSAPQMRGNFQQANTSFGIDHYAFSDLTANNGYHNKVTTPALVGGGDPTTSATVCIIYGKTITNNVGLLQYSRGVSNAVPTPITSLQSPSTPITLLPAGTTTVLDFTGITIATCELVAFNADLSVSGFIQDAVIFFDGTLFSFTNTSSGLKIITTGKTLQLQNNSAGTINKVYWTLKFTRLQ